jgi:hypothetical protein
MPREWGISATVERWWGVAFMLPLLLAAVVILSVFAPDVPIVHLPLVSIVVLFPPVLGLLVCMFLAGLILVIHSTR